MVRDFTYVEDIIEGVTRVIDKPPNNIKSPLIFPHGGKCQPGKESAKDGDIGGMESLSRNGGQYQSSSDDGEGKLVEKPESNSPSLSAPYKIYNIGNSTPIQLMDYIAAIETHLGKEAIKEFLPMQPGDVPRTEADVTDLVKDLGYKPDTTVERGIGKFIKWYKTYFNV